jgi:uncharacterized protein YcbK (DUF882 family)
MAFSSRTMRPADWDELRYFKASEFKEPAKMGYEFMRWLDRVRGMAGVPVRITSSYRSPEYNRSVGGATDSAHSDVPCNAVDIGLSRHPLGENFARFRLMAAALSLGCQRIGSYADGSLHFDRSEDKRPAPRIWRVVR